MTELKKLAGPVAIALLCAALLTLTDQLTGSRIDANYKARERSLLAELLGGRVTGQMLENATWQDNQMDFCAVGLIVSRFNTPGYAGSIQGLVAWQPDRARVAGIRITSHLETPGIADFLDDRSPGSWLNALLNRSGGQIQQIDTVSGATISSAAVQRGVAGVVSATGSLISDCRT